MAGEYQDDSAGTAAAVVVKINVTALDGSLVFAAAVTDQVGAVN